MTHPVEGPNEFAALSVAIDEHNEARRIERIADFLLDRDDALGTGEACQVEREESARHILTIVSTKPQGGDQGALQAQAPSVPTEGPEGAVVGLRAIEEARDAARYRRLRLLGCAVMNTHQLSTGTVLRFQNLDDLLDADMDAHPTRGEAPFVAPDPEEVRALVETIGRMFPAIAKGGAS